MGSFNTTCFVSKQNITRGDNVIIFPIIKQKTYNKVELDVNTHDGIKKMERYGYCDTICYPTAFWGYSGPMIYAQYDDYGQFELEDSEGNIHNLISFFNHLSTNICDVKEGENRSNESALVFDEIYDSKKQYTFKELKEVWNKIWNIFQQSRLFINKRNEPQSLAFAVMHQVTGEYLIKSYGKNKDWDDVSLEINSYFHTYINKMFKKMKEPVEEDMASFHQAYMTSNTMRLEGFGVGEQEGTYLSLHYSTNKETTNKFKNFIKDNLHLKSVPKKFTKELFKDFEQQIKHRYIASALSVLQLKLSPMISSGQDNKNVTGSEYLKMIESINKKVNEMVEFDND